MDFSDSQSGKGPCDRMAAVIKCNIRRYVNEKHDCNNAKEFVDASSQTKNVVIYASSIAPNIISVKNIDWSGITSYTNIQYNKISSRESSTTITTII
ncbi:unnamed protein product [Didymodactylos carnosus]|uniref:Uncharacterized protein n=1 Tax=Didymodactylos carnosus TaxID=1234261 RepID=A0A8S2GC45_9BILA|nr:unnamed protein product [Didymodactylos carnosus]CAF4574405.1 unnamed protein product [Didymodactylos carnosus]